MPPQRPDDPQPAAREFASQINLPLLAILKVHYIGKTVSPSANILRAGAQGSLARPAMRDWATLLTRMRPHAEVIFVFPLEDFSSRRNEPRRIVALNCEAQSQTIPDIGNCAQSQITSCERVHNTSLDA
jgi:hypothetical protein